MADGERTLFSYAEAVADASETFQRAHGGFVHLLQDFMQCDEAHEVEMEERLEKAFDAIGQANDRLTVALYSYRQMVEHYETLSTPKA